MRNTLSLLVAGAKTYAPSHRAQDRRLREVAANPAVATADDVETLVRAHGVPETKAWVVSDALALGLAAPIAWRWVMKYDGTALADAIAGGAFDLRDGALQFAAA